MRRWFMYVALLFLAQACSVSSAQTLMRNSHALLIGIGDYSASEGVSSLMGPANDIALVQGVLKTRFGIPEKNITVLLNEQATHSAVKKAFEDLAAVIGQGDFVYIHYSGHGSTREDKNERGGQDQTWVTSGSRNANFSEPDNRDVVDKEINLWLQPLYQKALAARSDGKTPIDLVLVSDSCHSGSVFRRVNENGITSVREVPTDLRKYPPIMLENSFASLPGVRIGAARDTESAIEIDTRTGHRCTDQKNCAGVFTWNWVKALQQAKPGERWEDVFKRTFTLVTADRFSAQRPQLEGHAEGPIFGAQFAAPSVTVAVTRVDPENKTAELAAGAASGVTKGSVYRLYTADSNTGSGLAELEITEVSEANASRAKLRRGNLEVGDLVTELSHAYHFKPTRLYLSGDFEEKIDKPLIQAVRVALEGLPGFEVTSDRLQADLIIYVLRPKKIDDQYVFDKSKRDRLPQSFVDQAPELWLVTPEGQLLHNKMRISFSDAQQGMRVLQKNLAALAWARQVRTLESPGGAPSVSVQISALRPDATCVSDCMYAPSDTTKQIPHRKIASYGLGETSTVVSLGDSMTFSLKNKDPKNPWYAYLLNVSPDGKVLRIYPTRYDNQEEARLNGDERVDLAKMRWLRLDDPGVETIKLIVSSVPVDIKLLENAEGFEKKGDLNPLEKLLREAGRGRGIIDEARIGDWGTVQADYNVPKK